MHLVYFEAVSDADFLPDEDRKMSYWQELPKIGESVALGGHRPWEIVGIDTYHVPAHPEIKFHICHCDIKSRTNRDQWPLVQRNRKRPATLHAYLGNERLVHWMVSLRGQEVKTGILLPQYDPNGRMIYYQSWGVEAVQVFIPSDPDKAPPYRAVVLGNCIYAPEALEQLVELVAAG